MAQWHEAFPLEVLPEGAAKVLAVGALKLAVFRVGDAVYAVDNACPHEGYPLAQGKLSGCVLTCNWHNFRFDLRDGRCLVGEEAVRAYPARVVEGRVQVDLAEPDPGPRLAARWASLEGATLERRMGQAIRDAGRLLLDGVPPEALLARLAALDGLHGEYGSSHGLAVAEEALGLLPRGGGPLDALGAVALVLDVVSEAVVRRPARSLRPPEPPEGSPERWAAALRAAVEADDADRAEAMVRGAVAAGWGRDLLEPALFGLCSDHFLDFGHALIYSTKVFDLLDRADQAGAADILGGLVYSIAMGTREDLLPEWAAWRKRVAELEPDLETLHHARVRGVGASWDRGAWVQQVLDGRPGEALAGTVEALRRGVPPVELVDGLTLAASERILRFDLAHDRDDTVQHGWLDVTHLLTFVGAVRVVLERWDDPRALRLLWQAVHFVRKQRPLDKAARPPLRPQPGGPDALLAAVDARDAERALALAAGLEPDELGVLRGPLMARALGDDATRPLVVAHRVKTLRAALDAVEALEGDARARWPLLAIVRLLASPVRERRVGRLVHEARQLLEHSRPPRTLC